MWKNSFKKLFGATLFAIAAAGAGFTPSLRAADEQSEPAATDEKASVVLESRNTRIEEQRRGGEVYMIEVQKRNAGSYVLMDRDGQGHRESRTSDVENDVDTAKWSLFRW